MKRILLWCGLAGLLLIGGYMAYETAMSFYIAAVIALQNQNRIALVRGQSMPAIFSSPSGQNLILPAPRMPNYAVIDVDAMAARMLANQDIYRKIRDEGLAHFAKSQTKTAADEQMKALIRISAYLWVWGDFYGECVWRQGRDYASDAITTGMSDPQASMFYEEYGLQSNHSASGEDAQRINLAAEALFSSGYPAQFKMQACTSTLQNLINYKTQGHGDPNESCFNELPALIKEWGKDYRQMIKEKWPDYLLSDAGDSLLCTAQDDEPTLNLAIAEIDEDFNEVDSANPVKIALDGQYFVNAAWCARGSDWASNVTDQGWKLFAERLVKADNILEAGYAKYPAEGEMARSMIDVELGQGQGRDRMELWFQRAIKADPDDYAAYKSKEWYLQPRWYGSEDDIVNFGQECVKTDNWAAKLPMILPTGLAEASDQDASLYSRDDIWNPLEKVYRDYLDRYPHSINYRTYFAKHAYDGGHTDVAREQFKILGSDWDRSVLTDSEYARIMANLNSK